MRSSFVKTIYSNGIPMEVSIVEEANIDDIVIAEAKIQAFGIGTGTLDNTRRVDVGVRDLLVRFGVER
jgi:hypothetical protein